MWWSVSHGREGLLRACSNWRHAVAVTLLIIGESNEIKNSVKGEDHRKSMLAGHLFAVVWSSTVKAIKVHFHIYYVVGLRKSFAIPRTSFGRDS